MWIPKHILEAYIRDTNDLKRRVKRLEKMTLSDAKSKIASLSDEKAGEDYKDGFLTIEEIIKKGGKL